MAQLPKVQVDAGCHDHHHGPDWLLCASQACEHPAIREAAGLHGHNGQHREQQELLHGGNAGCDPYHIYSQQQVRLLAQPTALLGTRQSLLTWLSIKPHEPAVPPSSSELNPHGAFLLQEHCSHR